MRGWIDRVVGGAGLLARRDASHLQRGDSFDFWIVDSIEAGTRLVLRSRMKMPGRAWLAFECLPAHDVSTLLRTIVSYAPGGFLGELYWALFYPFHLVIFNGMHRAIAQKSAYVAEAMACGGDTESR